MVITIDCDKTKQNLEQQQHCVLHLVVLIWVQIDTREKL
jgi:hypothetical protein